MRGVRDFVIAWTPWKVPARTSRSLVETVRRPSEYVLWKIKEPALEMIRRAKTGLEFALAGRVVRKRCNSNVHCGWECRDGFGGRTPKHAALPERHIYFEDPSFTRTTHGRTYTRG